MRRLLLVCLMLHAAGFSLYAQNQKICHISGEDTYHPPEYMSIEQAKMIAVERARIDAMVREFGSNISQTNTIAVSAHNGESKTDFQSLGTTEVNADWLADTSPPEFTVSYESGMLVIHTKVWGKARERIRTDYDLSIQTLRNGIESELFRNNDRFSIRFRSPVKGYFSIWLADDNLHQMYCLLPYENSDGTAREMQSNEVYTLLSTEDTMYPYREETILTAQNDVEFNRLIFIFSTVPFTMPLTTTGKYVPELKTDEFGRWLQRNRIKDLNMYVTQKMIEIRNDNIIR